MDWLDNILTSPIGMATGAVTILYILAKTKKANAEANKTKLEAEKQRMENERMKLENQKLQEKE